MVTSTDVLQWLRACVLVHKLAPPAILDRAGATLEQVPSVEPGDVFASIFMTDEEEVFSSECDVASSRKTVSPLTTCLTDRDAEFDLWRRSTGSTAK
jgi:hypothetical protein